MNNKKRREILVKILSNLYENFNEKSLVDLYTKKITINSGIFRLFWFY